MKNKTLGRRVLLGVSGLVFLVGLWYVLSPPLHQRLIQSQGARTLHLSAEAMKKNQEKQVSTFSDAIRPLTTGELLFRQFSQKELPGIGMLSIPALHIEVPIFNASSSENLMYGAGCAKPHQEMGKGNYALAGHTLFHTWTGAVVSNVLFGNLREAQVGQVLYLTDKDKVFEYTIDRMDIVKADQGERIEDHGNKKEVTLYTCTSLTGDERLVVHGSWRKTWAYTQNKKIFEEGTE